MDGLLLINKPIGITSFDIIRQLRRVTGFKKIGHAGTLDPQATGLMLLLFGPACKQAQSLSGLDKRYIAQVTLGSNSTTGDAEGELTAVSDRVATRQEVEAALAKLTGPITQTPSKYSAIKIDGKEAYKRARAGETVEMPSRQVTVYENTILDYRYPVIELNTKVSSGTYVRSLAEDLGGLIETGAHLTGLVRTEVGNYGLEDAIALDDVDGIATAELHLRSL